MPAPRVSAVCRYNATSPVVFRLSLSTRQESTFHARHWELGVTLRELQGRFGRVPATMWRRPGSGFQPGMLAPLAFTWRVWTRERTVHGPGGRTRLLS